MMKLEKEVRWVDDSDRLSGGNPPLCISCKCGCVWGGGCRWREEEDERQVSVAGAGKMTLLMVTHGAGEQSRQQTLQSLTHHAGDLSFLRSVLFQVVMSEACVKMYINTSLLSWRMSCYFKKKKN